jgi:anti-sigma-K factor RskA
MPADRDCGADAAAYALGALEPEEAEAFRRHLSTCSVCQDEVANFEQANAALAVSVPQVRAPRGLRRRIVRAARAEPKRQASAGPRRRRPALTVAIPRPALGAALGLLAAGGGAAGIVAASSGPALQVIHAQVIGSSGRAVVRVSGGHAELVVRRFPAPPRGRIYEVWLKRGGRPPSPTRALFSVTSSGSAEIGVPGSLSGVDAIMVTPEPQGGSPTPTRPPVIVARV